MPTIELEQSALLRVVLSYLREINCVKAMRTLEEESGVSEADEYGKVRTKPR